MLVRLTVMGNDLSKEDFGGDKSIVLGVEVAQRVADFLKDLGHEVKITEK